MRLCSIASGSSGNCIYVGHEEAHLLIDAGISGKMIEQGLNDIGVAPESLSGLLITHEHSDHIKGVGILARKYHLPIYATVETYVAMSKGKTNVGKLDETLFHPVEPETAFYIGNICVTPFTVSHDAGNPVAYTFEADEMKIGMATDLGVYTPNTICHLTGADVLYIEANHDYHMLMVGVYPYCLKQRIAGERGHLSNETTAELLCKLYHTNLQEIVLAHLSKENNFPELAYETVRAELLVLLENEDKLPKIQVAKRDVPSEMVIVKNQRNGENKA